MTKDQTVSLQERIVNEITSTYNSLATYKNHTSKIISKNKILDRPTAGRRIQVVEHKLKALKMMLAKIDDGDHNFCKKCHILITSKNKLLKNSKNLFCKNCV